MSDAPAVREATDPLLGWDATADRRWSALGLMLMAAAILLSPIAAALVSVTSSVQFSDATRGAALIVLPAIFAFQVSLVCAVALLTATLSVRTGLAGFFWVISCTVCVFALAPSYGDSMTEHTLGFYGGIVIAAFVISSVLRSFYSWRLAGRELHAVQPRLTILRLFVATTTAAVLLAIVAGRLRRLDASTLWDFFSALAVGLVVGGLLSIVGLALMALMLGRRLVGFLVSLPVVGLLLITSYRFASWNNSAFRPWTVRVDPAVAMSVETIAVLIGCLVPLMTLRLFGWHLRIGRQGPGGW